MSSILILGGTGYTGRRIAWHLLESSDAEVTIAARRVDPLKAFVEELNREHPGHRAAAVHADAADARTLRSAFRNHSLVVVASPTTPQADRVIRAALEEEVDYLDVQLGAGKLSLLRSLALSIQESGRCFITEAGFHPGLPAAMVRWAAASLDTLDGAVTACYLNMGKALPHTPAVDELMEALKDYRAQVYRDGSWTDPGTLAMREVDFGRDIGWKRCFSMFFEELAPLPRAYPTLKELGFYMSQTHWVTDWVVTPLALAGLRVAPKATRPLGRLFWWSMGTFHRPPYRVELQVQASGTRGGGPGTFKGVIAHPDGYELTAIAVVATLLQYLDGSARKPGLWMMGHLAEPKRLMADMGALGAEVFSEPSRPEKGDAEQEATPTA